MGLTPKCKVRPSFPLSKWSYCASPPSPHPHIPGMHPAMDRGPRLKTESPASHSLLSWALPARFTRFCAESEVYRASEHTEASAGSCLPEARIWEGPTLPRVDRNTAPKGVLWAGPRPTLTLRHKSLIPTHAPKPEAGNGVANFTI